MIKDSGVKRLRDLFECFSKPEQCIVANTGDNAGLTISSNGLRLSVRVGYEELLEGIETAYYYLPRIGNYNPIFVISDIAKDGENEYPEIVDIDVVLTTLINSRFSLPELKWWEKHFPYYSNPVTIFLNYFFILIAASSGKGNNLMVLNEDVSSYLFVNEKCTASLILTSNGELQYCRSNVSKRKLTIGVYGVSVPKAKVKSFGNIGTRGFRFLQKVLAFSTKYRDVDYIESNLKHYRLLRKRGA